MAEAGSKPGINWNTEAMAEELETSPHKVRGMLSRSIRTLRNVRKNTLRRFIVGIQLMELSGLYNSIKMLPVLERGVDLLHSLDWLPDSTAREFRSFFYLSHSDDKGRSSFGQQAYRDWCDLEVVLRDLDDDGLSFVGCRLLHDRTIVVVDRPFAANEIIAELLPYLISKPSGVLRHPVLSAIEGLYREWMFAEIGYTLALEHVPPPGERLWKVYQQVIDPDGSSVDILAISLSRTKQRTATCFGEPSVGIVPSPWEVLEDWAGRRLVEEFMSIKSE